LLLLQLLLHDGGVSVFKGRETNWCLCRSNGGLTTKQCLLRKKAMVFLKKKQFLYFTVVTARPPPAPPVGKRWRVAALPGPPLPKPAGPPLCWKRTAEAIGWGDVTRACCRCCWRWSSSRRRLIL
jgi:hypothetical protein